MFRYWDGHAWSEVISPTPLPGAPSSFASGLTNPNHGQNPGQTPGQPGGYDGLQPFVLNSQTTPADAAPGNAYAQFQTMDPIKPKKPVGMWIAIIVGVLVLALVIYFIVTRIVSGVNNANDNPVGNSTEQVCPQQPTSNQRATHPTGDGRVYGGALSYPQLPDPWSPVNTTEVRVPFGRDVAEQEIPIHSYIDSQGEPAEWVVSVLVGELNAGDGFYDPEQGSEIVNRCIFGTFYGDTQVTTDTLKSEAYSLDGHDGWITETNLSFSIPNLPTTSELAIVIIIQTSAESSSIFYASIPNDATQYQSDVNNAIAGLQVTT